MNALYASRPFSDEVSGIAAHQTPGNLIFRGMSALGAGTAVTALLAAILTH